MTHDERLSIGEALKFHSIMMSDSFCKFTVKVHLFCSSLSQYVHNVDSLSMDDDERKYVDARIDKLYEDIDKGMVYCCKKNVILLYIK